MITRIRSVLLTARGILTKLWLSPVRLLIAAAIFHMALTAAIFGIGRSALLPGTFDRNGMAVSVAPDGAIHRADAVFLSELLQRGQILGWLKAAHPFHLKLYSICFALFGPLLGLNIISIEPFNVLFYLAILVLVFKLGRETFNRRTGLLAAVAVALWPSFLLHTTQLLKDSLFVVTLLAFVLVMVRWLTRAYAWPTALLTGISGGLIALVLWLARDSMEEILLASVFLGAVMLIIRQFKEKRVEMTNLVGMTLMLAITVSVTLFLPKFRNDQDMEAVASSSLRKALRSGVVREGMHASRADDSHLAPWSRMAARVGTVRHSFITTYPDSGSNIDSNVELTSMADLVRYIPRAAAIGFFAPFPNMWFSAGKKLGSTARLLSGAETLAMYAIEALAVFGLWRGRRWLPVWLLFSVATTALIALGFVVINVGALFRLRYAFIILIIIIGAEGAAHIFGWSSTKPAEAQEPRAAG